MKANASVDYHNIASIDGIEMAVVNRSRNVFPRHYHDNCFSIGLLDQGGSYCLNNKDDRVLTTKDSLALINPGQVHTGIPADTTAISYKMIYIQNSEFQKIAREISEIQCEYEFNSLVSHDPQLRLLMDTFADAFLSRRDTMEIESSLMFGISHLISKKLCHPKSTAMSVSAYAAAEELLSTGLDENISLASISNELGMSRYQFLRAFKKAYGITPHAYRTQRRLEKAAYYLRTGLTPAETAVKTGFSDQSHFARTFRQYYAATPGQYSRIF